MRKAISAIASEPLLHFTLLGALVFAGYGWSSGGDQTPTIELSPSKRRELEKLFEQRHGRSPSAAEREQAVRRFVEDEALFREGLRLSLVHTDPMLRAQIIARMRAMLQAEAEQRLPADVATPEARKSRTAAAFQLEVQRLTAQFRVRTTESP